MDNTFMKNMFSKTKNLMRSIALFYIFVNVFNVWGSRKQLYSPIRFCTESVVISQVMQPLGKFHCMLREKESEKGNHISV